VVTREASRRDSRAEVRTIEEEFMKLRAGGGVLGVEDASWVSPTSGTGRSACAAGELVGTATNGSRVGRDRVTSLGRGYRAVRTKAGFATAFAEREDFSGIEGASWVHGIVNAAH
jgi:hypothetical protein